MIPRGIRNNNPGNIRVGDDWNGLVEEPTDKSFCQFIAACYGIRAMVVILLKYYKKHKLHTVEQIINRWSPSVENDTHGYVDHVCFQLNVRADESLNLTDKRVMEALVRAIIKHENGVDPYTYEVRDGILLAWR